MSNLPFMLRNCLNILLLILIPVMVLPQTAQPVRFEAPTRSGTDPFNHVACGDQGVCLFYPTIEESGKDSVSWSFYLLDRNFQKIWQQRIPLREDVSFLKSIYRNNCLYLLFHDTKRNDKGNISVFFFIPSKQILTEHHSDIPYKADIVDFEVLNDLIFIGYNEKKSKPGLIAFSLIDGQKRNFEISAEDDALLLDVAVDSIYKGVYATYKVQKTATRNNLYINKYDLSSALRSTTTFEGEVEKRIINSAEYIPLSDTQGLVAGCYGYSNRGRRTYDYYNDYYNYYYYNSLYNRPYTYDANKDNTPVSDGYFSSLVGGSSPPALKYYNFVDFNNALKITSDMDILRLRRRNEKKEKTGLTGEDNTVDDDNNSLNYRILMHSIIASDGKFLLLGETYYPEYHTMTQMVYDYYGRAFPSTYSVFDGFRYCNAFLAAFDSSGVKVWDNGMEMRDILTTYLNHKMNYIFDGDEMTLFYNANGKLAVKTIKGPETVEHTEYVTIAPKRQTDEVTSEYLGTMEHWYGKYFLASGYETIRNNFLTENKRNVFYLNKMAFE